MSILKILLLLTLARAQLTAGQQDETIEVRAAAFLASRPKTPFESIQSSLFSTINASVPALLKGLYGNYSRSAYASPYIIWAPGAFPIALGGGQAPLPVVVGVDLPSTSSRLVAFGHEGIVSGCCVSNDDWDRLTLNTVRWLAAGKTVISMATPVKNWGETTLPNVKEALQDMSVTTSFMDLDTFAGGGWETVDIYWIDTYLDYPAAHIAALLKFANQPGKGLLVGGHIWYWSYSNPHANIFTDHPINKLLWPLGLVVTPDIQYGFQPAPFKPPTPNTPYYNAYYLANMLAYTKARGTIFSFKSFFPAVNAVFKHLLQWLPPRALSSVSGLDDVWPLLDVARMGGSPAASPTALLNPATGYPSKVLDAYVECASNRFNDLTALKVSRSAKGYPRLVPPGTPRVSATVTIDCTIDHQPLNMTFGNWDAPVWRSTGLYAPAGHYVTVTVLTAAAVGQGLKVQVGAHTDDLSDSALWKRVPYAFTCFDLTSTSLTVGNPLGGLIYILVPSGSSLGNVQLTFSNVVRAPYFKLGSTDASSWNTTISKHPAPWAELDSGKFVMTIPSSAVRDLDDPTPLLQFWNQVLDDVTYLAHLPTQRVRAERLVLDTDIAGGWIHSGYPMVLYDNAATQKTVADLEHLQTKGAWWAYHLLGNNHILADMVFPGSVEALNNLFTIYILEQTGVPPTSWENWDSVSPEARAAKRTEYFSFGAHWDTDWWGYTALDTFLQLKEGFGWEFYRNVFAAYQKAGTIQEDLVQAWIKITSNVAGVNLIPFYSVLGFPITNDTSNTLSPLPAWKDNPLASWA